MNFVPVVGTFSIVTAVREDTEIMERPAVPVPPRKPPPVLSKITVSTAVLTMNRPERLNALDPEIIEWLEDMLKQIEEEPDIHAVILTGAGECAFSVSLNPELPSAEHGRAETTQLLSRRIGALARYIENFSKPVVAAVNGLAVGCGWELVVAAHLVIASEHAQFGIQQIKYKLSPPMTRRRSWEVGRKRAMEMMLMEHWIKATDAERIGLINRVVPHEKLISEALRTTLRVVEHAPRTVASRLFATRLTSGTD